MGGWLVCHAMRSPHFRQLELLTLVARQQQAQQPAQKCAAVCSRSKNTHAGCLQPCSVNMYAPATYMGSTVQGKRFRSSCAPPDQPLQTLNFIANRTQGPICDRCFYNLGKLDFKSFLVHILKLHRKLSSLCKLVDKHYVSIQSMSSSKSPRPGTYGDDRGFVICHIYATEGLAGGREEG
jgi:hypothetical protein